MTKEVAKKSPPYEVMSLPAEEAREIAKVLKDNGIRGMDLPRITFPSGKPPYMWNVPTPEGPRLESKVRGIILQAHNNRAFWDGDYGEARVPKCTSEDAVNGSGFHNGVEGASGPCSECRFSKHGSAEKGDGQACKQRNRLFLMRPEGVLPVILSVPSGSLRKVRDYIVTLLGARITRPFLVETEFSLVEQKNTQQIDYAQIQMAMVRKLEKEEVEMVTAFAREWQGLFEEASRADLPENGGADDIT